MKTLFRLIMMMVVVLGLTVSADADVIASRDLYFYSMETLLYVSLDLEDVRASSHPSDPDTYLTMEFVGFDTLRIASQYTGARLCIDDSTGDYDPCTGDVSEIDTFTEEILDGRFSAFFANVSAGKCYLTFKANGRTKRGCVTNPDSKGSKIQLTTHP